jgi:hypothetical protein
VIVVAVLSVDLYKKRVPQLEAILRDPEEPDEGEVDPFYKQFVLKEQTKQKKLKIVAAQVKLEDTAAAPAPQKKVIWLCIVRLRVVGAHVELGLSV